MRLPCRKPQADSNLRQINRRMDSGAAPQSVKPSQTQHQSRARLETAMSEAASGFQPPQIAGGWIAKRSAAIRRAIARSTSSTRQTHKQTGGWIAQRSAAIRHDPRKINNKPFIQTPTKKPTRRTLWALSINCQSIPAVDQRHALRRRPSRPLRWC